MYVYPRVRARARRKGEKENARVWERKRERRVVSVRVREFIAYLTGSRMQRPDRKSAGLENGREVTEKKSQYVFFAFNTRAC